MTCNIHTYIYMCVYIYVKKGGKCTWGKERVVFFKLMCVCVGFLVRKKGDGELRRVSKSAIRDMHASVRK